MGICGDIWGYSCAYGTVRVEKDLLPRHAKAFRRVFEVVFEPNIVLRCVNSAVQLSCLETLEGRHGDRAPLTWRSCSLIAYEFAPVFLFWAAPGGPMRWHQVRAHALR